MSEQLQLRESAENLQISLGHMMLNANNISDGTPVITGNYINPQHELPLPWPDGDWYLRQTFVPAVRPGETVVCNTLVPGLLEYYRDVGLIEEGAGIIEVETPQQTEPTYGFPYTDPLTTLSGEVAFENEHGPAYLCSTFNGELVGAQADSLSLRSIQRASSELSNNKARLRQASEEFGFDMVPGMTLGSWDEVKIGAEASWNSAQGCWLKFPTGSGGDLVVNIPGPFTEDRLASTIMDLRSVVGRAFAEGGFEINFDDFWPLGNTAPTGFPLVLESDATYLGDLVTNGSTQFVTTQSGETHLVGHYSQMTTGQGEYLGNAPIENMDTQTAELIEAQVRAAANYNAIAHKYFGIAATDWFLIRDLDGEQRVVISELNARPTANTPPAIIAQKLGAKHFVNINAYTGREITNIDDFVDIVGADLAYGDPQESGIVIPQAFRTLVTRRQTTASPNFKIVALGRDSEHCQQLLTKLSERSVRFSP